MQNERLPLATNIRILRKMKGLNQEQLAEKLNIKRSNIAAYETKNVEPRLRIILELARFFDISISALLQEELDPNAPFPPFLDPEAEKEVEVSVVNLDTKDVNIFIDKSMSIKKILEGFKSFYNFRKSKLKDLTPQNQKIIFDIENFIHLMEDLIAHNESMISMLSSSKK